MAELAHGTQPEFWRPPTRNEEEDAPMQDAVPTMAEVCPRCSTEFLLGSRFCHTCGGRRPEAISSEARADAAAIAGLWDQTVHVVRSTVSWIPWGKLSIPSWLRPSWLHYLHFHEIKERVGLSTGSLVAFVIGLACVTGALLVGFLTAKTLVDWQAIQYYRAEWLLGATASFVAGILLKKYPSKDN